MQLLHIYYIVSIQFSGRHHYWDWRVAHLLLQLMLMIDRTGVSYAVQQQAGHQVVTEHSLMSRVDKEAGSASSRMTQRRAAVSHADTVLDLCELNLPGDKILLSGSADGIVKAWK